MEKFVSYDKMSKKEKKKLTVELEAKKKIQKDLEAGQESLRAERDAMIEKKYKLNSAIESLKSQIEVSTGIAASHMANIKASETKLAILQEEVSRLGDEVPENPPSEETIKRNLRTAEAEMEALGTVNPLAVEECGMGFFIRDSGRNKRQRSKNQNDSKVRKNNNRKS